MVLYGSRGELTTWSLELSERLSPNQLKARDRMTQRVFGRTKCHDNWERRKETNQSLRALQELTIVVGVSMASLHDRTCGVRVFEFRAQPGDLGDAQTLAYRYQKLENNDTMTSFFAGSSENSRSTQARAYIWGERLLSCPSIVVK